MICADLASGGLELDLRFSNIPHAAREGAALQVSKGLPDGTA